MNTRERFGAVMDFRPFDKLPVLEWAGWWDRTIERWHGEGLPETCTDRYDICRHFGLEVHVQRQAHGIHWDCPIRPPHHGAGLLTAANDDFSLIEPHLGRWPVIQDQFSEHLPAHERGEICFWFTLPGFFALPRKIFGIERHLYAFYDEPELMRRINRINAEWACGYIDRLCEHAQPDYMSFMEDMSYNNGPMISRKLWDEFIKPYYDIVVPKLREHNIRIFIDSDGDITDAALWFIESGIDGVFPLERQAGVDVASLRRDHPELRLMGGFDKMEMNKGEDALRAEFERLVPAAAQGGFIISCDHQTPPSVSYRNYRKYVELFHEYAESAAKGDL